MMIEATSRFDLLVRGGTVVRAEGSRPRMWRSRMVGSWPWRPSIPAGRRGRGHRRDRPAGAAGCHRRPHPHPHRQRRGAGPLLPGHGRRRRSGARPRCSRSTTRDRHQRRRRRARCWPGVREWLERTSGDAAIDVGLSAVITAQQDEPVGGPAGHRRPGRGERQVLPGLRLRHRRGAAGAAAAGAACAARPAGGPRRGPA